MTTMTVTPTPAPPSLSQLDLMTAPQTARGPLARLAWDLGTTVAAEHADDVDRNARFPAETLAALREHHLLSALVPTELGGGGESIGAVAAAVRALAAGCTSSALVLAMHSIQVIALVRFGTTPTLRAFLRDLAQDQLLVADANSEVGVGSEPGRSICGLERTEGRWKLEKQALAISYGAHADAVVATARRTVDSPPTDQIFALTRRGDFTLAPTSGWDTIGLRGTCSNSFTLRASGTDDAIFPDPFPRIAAAGHLHAGQILLSAVWVGLAEKAVGLVHARVRSEARRAIGTTPPAAFRLADLVLKLQSARSMLAGAIQTYEALVGTEQLEDPGQLIAARNLKIATSTIAADLATEALTICGIQSYRRDSPQSLDRLLRDAHGGLVMVGNDSNRKLNAQALIARKVI